jgi:anti-sigma factor RsiW
VSCARYRAQLSRYLDDELPPRQRSELLAHVATCPDCAAALARFRQSEVLLKKLPERKPSADVRGAV